MFRLRIAMGALLLATIVTHDVARAQMATELEKTLRGPGSAYQKSFHIIGNIYYVGATGISSFLIATNDGLILLDTGTQEMQRDLYANIRQLGFRLTDIRIILSSHAHWDHVEGHAEMQQITGAQVMALGADADAIAAGKDNSAMSNRKLALGWKPTHGVRKLEDGQQVRLGEVTMTPHLTAGHTRGCTTWTMDVEDKGKPYCVVFYGGVSAKGIDLFNDASHPGIRDDFRRSFEFLESLNPDVYLAQHPWSFSMTKKLDQRAVGGPNPFIDPQGYKALIRREKGKFEKQLSEQRLYRLNITVMQTNNAIAETIQDEASAEQAAKNVRKLFPLKAEIRYLERTLRNFDWKRDRTLNDENKQQLDNLSAVYVKVAVKVKDQPYFDTFNTAFIETSRDSKTLKPYSIPQGHALRGDGPQFVIWLPAGAKPEIDLSREKGTLEVFVVDEKTAKLHPQRQTITCGGKAFLPVPDRKEGNLYWLRPARESGASDSDTQQVDR